jgi:RNA polymerase sigma-70 factor, ECF subfamily
MSSLRRPTSPSPKPPRPNPPRPNPESINLLRWIAIGDEVSFRRFYDATNGLLFGLLLRILGDTEKAEGVLSDLYAEIRQNAPSCQKRNESSLVWLILTAHRCALEHICRHLPGDVQKSDDSDKKVKPVDIHQSAINITEQRRLIRRAIQTIPLSQQLKIELAFFHGKTNLEISNELGESLQSVEDGIRSGMSQLFSIFKFMRFSPTSDQPS